MARRAEAVKHPALMAKALRDRVMAMDNADAESLPGWETFTPDRKQFLMVYPWFGEKKMAAEYIGRNAQWFDRRQRQSQIFKDAVNSRASSTSRIARQYGADLLGKAMLRLEEMLEPNGADKRTQLEAIKLLMRMNGTAETEEPPAPVKTHDLNNIIMFGTEGEKQRRAMLGLPVDEGQVVEGQVVDKTDESELEFRNAGRW